MKGRNSQSAMESSMAEEAEATEDAGVSRAAVRVSLEKKEVAWWVGATS